MCNIMSLQNFLAWSEAVYAAEGAMTKEKFLSYAAEALGEGAECLFERIAECQSEINMFGDSGPGSMYRLRQSVDEYNQIGRRYAELTGSHFTPARMPVYRS